MAPISLADSSITSATPGVLVKGTVDPVATPSVGVVAGQSAGRRISDQIDTSYIVNGDEAYWTSLSLASDGRMFFRLGVTADESGTQAGPQFTEAAEDDIWIILFYGTDSAAWDFSVLDNDDEDEPYEFSAGTVTLAGPTNNLALRNAINADSTVIAMLVDSSHPQIDIANLSTRDLALEVGATATLPGLTASGGAELVDPVPLLALADFDGAGLDTSPALALLMRGDASNGAGIWGRGPRAVSGSALLDGEFDLPPSDEPINLIRFRDSGSDYGSERISFHDNGPLHLGTYFSSGDGSDLTLWIQTGTGAADIAEIPMQANYDRGGGNFAIIDVPAQYQSIVGSIDPGDRFILAMTRVPIPDDLEIGGTATLPSLTAEGGVEISSVAPLEVGGAATLPGLTGEAGVAFSDAAPLQVGAAATLPGLTATGGVELSDVAPLEIGGAATLPSMTGEGGVDFVSGVVQPAISDQTTRAGQAFTFCPPEPTGGFLPLVFTASNLPPGLNVHAGTGLIYGVPSSVATVTVTLTVTDDQGNTSSQSFDIEVEAATPPKIAPISLADSSITSDSPGILVKGVVSPNSLGGNIRIVLGNLEGTRISDAIDSSYVVGGAESYWTSLRLDTDGSMLFAIGIALDSFSGVQFTEDTEDVIYIVVFYGSDSAVWDFSALDNSDEDNPYDFTAASVTAAGPTNNAALRTAVFAERANTIAMLVDSSVDGIDIADLNFGLRDDWDNLSVPTVSIDIADTAIQVNEEIKISATVTRGGDNDILTYAYTSDLAGGKFTPHYGKDTVFSSPKRGTYNITLTVQDEDGNVVTDTVTISVFGVAIAEINDIGLEIGNSHNSVLPEATGGIGPYDYEVTNLPTGATFTESTRTLAWTPSASGGYMVTYTATDTDNGLSASRSFLLMAHLPGIASYVVLIDWDGDRLFAHDNADIFPDVDMRSGLRVKRGRNYGSQVYGRSVSGTFETRLVNYHGRYDKDSSTSVLAGLIVPRRRIIWAAAADSVVYRLWAGFLDDIAKIDKQGGDDIARLTGTDIIALLVRDDDASIPYTASTTTGPAAEGIVEQSGIDDDDVGDLLGSTVLAHFYQDKASPWRQLRAVEEAEGGFLWVSGRGRLFLDDSERRASRARSLTSQMTLTDSPTPGAGEVKILPRPRFRDPLKDLANLVRARVRTWTVGDERELWRLDEEIALAAGDSIILRPQYMGSDSSPAVAEWIDPQPCEDYQAWSMTGGAGTELTGTLDVALVAGATEAALTITNEHATATLYVSLVKLRGKRLEEGDPVEVEVRDTDSIDAYGTRPYTIATSLLSAVMDARDYADEIVRLYAQPTRKGTLKIQANSIFAEALPLELSDRVSMTLRDFSGPMYVEAIGHALMPGLRHDMELTLSQVP